MNFTMSLSVTFNALGLACDLISAFLLYEFGLPTVLKLGGHSTSPQEGQDKPVAAQSLLGGRWVQVGLRLWIVGLGLQSMSLFVLTF